MGSLLRTYLKIKSKEGKAPRHTTLILALRGRIIAGELYESKAGQGSRVRSCLKK